MDKGEEGCPGPTLQNKLDNAYEVRHDLSCSVCYIDRMRADGYQVIDRPRSRVLNDTLTQNHGGVAAITSAGASLNDPPPELQQLVLNFLASFI